MIHACLYLISASRILCTKNIHSSREVTMYLPIGTIELDVCKIVNIIQCTMYTVLYSVHCTVCLSFEHKYVYVVFGVRISFGLFIEKINRYSKEKYDSCFNQSTAIRKYAAIFNFGEPLSKNGHRSSTCSVL